MGNQRVWAHYQGAIPFTELYHRYAQLYLGLFAVSCENLAKILIEMMAAGLLVDWSNLVKRKASLSVDETPGKSRRRIFWYCRAVVMVEVLLHLKRLYCGCLVLSNGPLSSDSR